MCKPVVWEPLSVPLKRVLTIYQHPEFPAFPPPHLRWVSFSLGNHILNLSTVNISWESFALSKTVYHIPPTKF